MTLTKLCGIRAHRPDERPSTGYKRVFGLETHKMYEELSSIESVQQLHAELCNEHNRITPLSIKERCDSIGLCREHNGWSVGYCEVSALKSILAVVRLLVMSVKDCGSVYLNINYSELEMENIMGAWVDFVISHHSNCYLEQEEVFNPFEIIEYTLGEEEYECITKEWRVFALLFRVLSHKTGDTSRITPSVSFRDELSFSGVVTIGKICDLVTACLLDANTYEPECTKYSVAIVGGVLNAFKDFSFFDKMYVPELVRLLELCKSTVYKNESLAKAVSAIDSEVTTVHHIRNNKMLSFVNKSFCDTIVDCV